MQDNSAQQPEDQLEYQSKTQLKKQMESLQQLGEALLKLNDKDRSTVPIPEILQEAFDLANKIRGKNEAYRRQMQYIGKLMRSIDVEPIEQALASLNRLKAEENQKFHNIEQLRDDLIDGGDGFINETLEQYPNLERQMLRQLIRNINKERKLNKPPKAYRELFKYLREHIEL